MKLKTLIEILFIAVLSAGTLFAAKTDEDKFKKIIKASEQNDWQQLEYGSLITAVGKQFLGVPYVGGTLEGDQIESCTVVLDKLDCVTFYETSMAFADIIRTKENPIFNDLLAEVERTRYRGGKVSGYESRLHYTSEWIIDNIHKGTVKDITKSLGGIRLDLNLDFMSEHPQYYPKLKNNPNMVKKIAGIEADINKHSLYYIPRDKVSSIMDKLQSGDIIAFVSKVKGLDYDHTGMIDAENGIPKLLHASSSQEEVVIGKPIDEYINGISKFRGITVVRPIPPEQRSR